MFRESQKYLVCKRSETNRAREWFDQCKMERRPYILVEIRTRFADVRFDNVTYLEEDLGYFNDCLNLIENGVLSIFEKHAVKASDQTIHASFIYLENIPNESAEMVASQVYDLLIKYLPTPKSDESVN